MKNVGLFAYNISIRGGVGLPSNNRVNLLHLMEGR